MAAATDPALDFMAALVTERADLRSSYSESLLHLQNALRIISAIGGHLTPEDQAQLRDARAFLKEAT